MSLLQLALLVAKLKYEMENTRYTTRSLHLLTTIAVVGAEYSVSGFSRCNRVKVSIVSGCGSLYQLKLPGMGFGAADGPGL